jgi:hypothetical protein
MHEAKPPVYTKMYIWFSLNVNMSTHATEVIIKMHDVIVEHQRRILIYTEMYLHPSVNNNKRNPYRFAS